MAEQERKQRTTGTSGKARQAEEVADAPAKSESGQKLKDEMDELLDEIDDVLETNAEDFVKSYVQKGGQ